MTSKLLECLPFCVLCVRHLANGSWVWRLRLRLHYVALHLLFEAQTEQNPTLSQSTHTVPPFAKPYTWKRVCSCKHFNKKMSAICETKTEFKSSAGKSCTWQPGGYSDYTWKNIIVLLQLGRAGVSLRLPLMTSFSTLWELCVVRRWLHEKPLDFGFCKTTNYTAVCSAICLPFCHT